MNVSSPTGMWIINVETLTSTISGACLQRNTSPGGTFPSKTHLKPNSLEILFVHKFCPNHPIVLKFSTEHGSITVLLFVKFQND